MSIEILRANAMASALLAGIGVNIGDTITLAQQAQAELMKKKTAEEAGLIASMISGFEAAALANVTNQVALTKQLDTAKTDLQKLARAKDYMIAGNSTWPLKKALGFPVPGDIKNAGLDVIPDAWTPPAPAAAAAAS